MTATGESSRVSLPAMTAVGTASPVAPTANTVMLFPPVLATYRALVTTFAVTVTLALAEMPALAAVTAAVPGAVPALKVVAVSPVASVCPLVTSSGGLPATPTSAVTLQATVDPTSGPPCRSRSVALMRSVPSVGRLAVAALTATLPGMPRSIRNRIGRVRPSFSAMRSPVATSFTSPGVGVSHTSANPSSRRVPISPAATCRR